MKKYFGLFLALLCILGLCACGGEIPKGTYKATAFEAGGETVEGEEALGMFKDFSIIIKDGKTADMCYGEQSHTVSYTLDGERFTLGDGGMTGVYKDGKINLKFGDTEDGCVVFEKVD